MNVGDKVVLKTKEEYEECIKGDEYEKELSRIHQTMINHEYGYADLVFVVVRKFTNSAIGKELLEVNLVGDQWEHPISLFADRLKLYKETTGPWKEWLL